MKFLIREAVALIAAAVIGLCAVVGCLAYKCDSYKEREPDNASFTGVMGKTSAEFENYAHFSLVDTNYEPAVFLENNSSDFIAALQGGKYNCLSKYNALLNSLFLLNRLTFDGSFSAGNKSGKTVIYFMVYDFFGTVYLSAESHDRGQSSISIYKCKDKSLCTALNKFDEKNGYAKYVSPSYKVWQSFYDRDTDIENLLLNAFIILSVVSFATLSVLLNIRAIIEFIRSRKKGNVSEGEKKLSKVLEVLLLTVGGITTILVVSLIVFSVLGAVQNVRDEHIEVLGDELSIRYYRLMGDKIKMKEYNELDEKMLYSDENDAEHSLCSYYIDSDCCYSLKSYDNKKFFFGPDERDLQMCVKFVNGFSDARWHAREDYTLPDIKTERIKRLLVVGENSVESDLSQGGISCFSIVENDKGNAEYIYKRELIQSCVSQFEKGNYDLSSLNLCTPPNESDYYIVLAEFNDSVVYQCLGYLK